MSPTRFLAVVAALILSVPLKAADPVDTARAAVLAEARDSAGIVDARLEVTDAYRSAHNGLWHVHFRQVVTGLPVINANANANVDARGNIHGAHQRLVAAAESQASPRQPSISAMAAIDAFARQQELGHWVTPRAAPANPATPARSSPAARSRPTTSRWTWFTTTTRDGCAWPGRW